jgi:hypothetical protein
VLASAKRTCQSSLSTRYPSRVFLFRLLRYCGHSRGLCWSRVLAGSLAWASGCGSILPIHGPWPSVAQVSIPLKSGVHTPGHRRVSDRPERVRRYTCDCRNGVQYSNSNVTAAVLAPRPSLPMVIPSRKWIRTHRGISHTLADHHPNPPSSRRLSTLRAAGPSGQGRRIPDVRVVERCWPVCVDVHRVADHHHALTAS